MPFFPSSNVEVTGTLEMLLVSMFFLDLSSCFIVYFRFQRGKFYPQVNYLVKVNTPRAVLNETKKAFKKLPNLEQAITALSNLKGVGTTMASGKINYLLPDKF